MKNLAIAVLAVGMALGANYLAWAQSTCTTDCADRYDACTTAASSTLSSCLATARTARERNACTSAFLAARNVCRTDLKDCLAGCSD